MLKNKKAREGIAFLLGIVLILALIEAGSALKGDRLVFPQREKSAGLLCA